MNLRLRWAALALTVLAFATGACSKPSGEGVATAGGGNSQTQTNPSAASDNPAERVRQFVECMRAEGVDLPDPEPGDNTGKTSLRFAYDAKDKNEIGSAMEKCNEFLPQGGERLPRTPEQIEQNRVFARCVRENGIPDFPDPGPDGEFSADAGINKEDPAVRAAIDKCRSPQGGGK
jgi:hypothetical protein